MFVDTAQVRIKAGDGGDGAVSFRQEKFIDRGGPDGGDGGRGGNVVFSASRNQNTLAAFRYQKELTAEPGKPGFQRRKHGRSGKDLVVMVPVGTVVLDADGVEIADLNEDGQEVIIAKGGKGGFGNAHFVSSVRQAPRVAEKGEEGQEIQASLELRMIADVGLIGLPNAGKSTLLASLSNARPEIADYPFTTLKPNLGVVDIDAETSVLVADIPGLIEGASEGKGLGDAFLRHVERTLVLVHLIDAYGDNIVADYKTIQAELASYRINLAQRPQLVAVSKIDGLDDEIVADLVQQLRTVVPEDTQVLAFSSQSKQGLKPLLYAIKAVVVAERSRVVAEEEIVAAGPVVLRLQESQETWKVTRIDGGFLVTGSKIEGFAGRTDFENYHGVQRLRDIMRRMGILRELKKLGIDVGDKIFIGTAKKYSISY